MIERIRDWWTLNVQGREIIYLTLPERGMTRQQAWEWLASQLSKDGKHLSNHAEKISRTAKPPFPVPDRSWCRRGDSY